MGLPANAHPVVRAKYAALYEDMKVLAIELRQEVELLEKTLEVSSEDDFGVKMRVAGIESKSAKMSWVAAKLVVLSTVSYEINSEAKAPRRRRSPKRPRRG